ncbi:MAG: hypothetical protein EPO31_00860 [Gammaproteobacteria bacterium]|jgi:hypothetical protein|nr:MAG: hypothetical protein EPO31_00860 [Gammaproteobacteria bacterium]
MTSFDDFVLGRTEDTIPIETREENRLATVQMARQARRALNIVSRDLNPEVYDTPEFTEAVKDLILRNHRSRIRIMSFDTNSIVSRGHRLVTLAMDLSSFIECRIPASEYNHFNQELFIADHTGYLQRLNCERYDGKLSFNDRRAVRHLLGDFDEMWDRAAPNPNFRRLVL